MLNWGDELCVGALFVRRGQGCFVAIFSTNNIYDRIIPQCFVVRYQYIIHIYSHVVYCHSIEKKDCFLGRVCIMMGLRSTIVRLMRSDTVCYYELWDFKR